MHLFCSPWPVEVKKIHHSEGDGQHTKNKVRDGQVQDEDVPGCLGDFIPKTRKEYVKISTKSKRKNEAIYNQEHIVGYRGY